MADARNGKMSLPVTEAAMRKNGYRTDLPTGVMRPQAEGLYNRSRNRRVRRGLVVNLKNSPSQKIVQNGLARSSRTSSIAAP